MRVLVTGAASGIGRATCVRLAQDAKAAGRAARVAAVDVGPSPGLDSLVAELRELGAEALPLHGDMGTPDAPARVVDAGGPALRRSRRARQQCRHQPARARSSSTRSRTGTGSSP